MIGEVVSYNKIIGKLGPEGMGIICKPHDLKFKTIISLKVLYESFTKD